MPIYEYKCPKCDKKVEIINPKNGVYCECGKEMRKLISAPAFRIYTKFPEFYLEKEKQLQQKRNGG